MPLSIGARSDMRNALSLAWRCIPCGRVLLGDERRMHPRLVIAAARRRFPR